MNLAAALVALIAVAVIAYLVTVVHAATVRTLAREPTAYQPEQRLLAWPKWLVGLLAALLVIWLLHRVRAILLPFIMGGIVAYLLNPGIDRLERRRWPRNRAVWLVFGLFLLIFALGALLLVPKMAAEARDFVARYGQFVEQVQHAITQAQHAIERRAKPIGILPQDVRNAFGALGDKAQAYGLALLEGGLAWLNRSLVVLSLLIITPVVAFWLLRDYHKLGRKLYLLLPERQRAPTLEVLRDINRVAGSYLLGMAIMVVIVGIFTSLLLTIAGVRFSVLLGLTTGMLSVIPYLGYPTALLLIILTMAATGETLGPILIVFIILVAANIAFDYAVAPRVVGRRVGLHPLAVIFAILAGGALFGFLGVVIAVPLTGAIKVVLVHFWPDLFSFQAPDQSPKPEPS